MRVKEKLKKYPFIVGIYESIFGRLHKLRRKVINQYRIIYFRMNNKTRFCYGEKNQNKTFFVIPATEKCGLYSNIFIALPIMEYAKRRGYISVLDFKNSYASMLQDEDKKGLENAWEYYYEQPERVSLEEVYQSKRVIHYSGKVYPVKIPDWNSMFPTSEQELIHWHNFIVNNIHLQRSLEERIEKTEVELFAGKKILGIGVRAGFRAASILKKPSIAGHPIVPACEEMMQIVENKMKEWDYSYIFLSCDDREYQQKFLKYFGDRCIVMERHLKHYFENGIPICNQQNIHRVMCEYKDISKREEVEEYIVEVYLLSKCDSLYSCIGGGAEFAYFLNGGKYEHLDVYNEGMIHL